MPGLRLTLTALVTVPLAACSAPVSVIAFRDCAGPSVTVKVREAEPGEVVTVKGSSFFVDCPQDARVPPTAVTDPIALHFVQKGEVHDLGSVTANPKSGKFSVEVTIPETARPGDGRIRAEQPVRTGTRITITSG